MAGLANPEENARTVSDCHGAPVDETRSLFGNPHAPEYSCSECRKRCVATWPPCPEGACDGSGLVSKSTWDQDSKCWVPDGEEECVCRDSNNDE
jgi:hypothetical protein